MRIVLLLLFAASAATSTIDPSGKRICGEWRGTSRCTNLALAPSCKDETVRYVFTGPIGGKNTYHAAADKLVGKDYRPMGEMDFTYDARDSTWSSPLDVPSCKECRWRFRIPGSQLIGGLNSGAQDTLRSVIAIRHLKSRGEPPHSISLQRSK